MILEQRNKKPQISFDFYQTETTVSVGTLVDIWINYLTGEVSINGAVKINNSHFQVQCDVAGTFEYYAETRTQTGQTIKINVI
jgi:hypothetical protein